MNRFFLSVVLCFVCVTAHAQHNARSRKWDRVGVSVSAHDPAYIEVATAAIREVMEQNFQAASAEDLKALMATMTSNCPDRENFQKECKKMFEETDVYMRLVDCRWITSWRDSKGLWAAVDIKQWTVPKDDNVAYTEYRHRSGLLPEYELCTFQLYCRVENGQWKAHKTNGNIFPAEWPNDQAPARLQEIPAAQPAPAAQVSDKKGDCPDGTCPNQWPTTPVGRPRMTMK